MSAGPYYVNDRFLAVVSRKGALPPHILEFIKTRASAYFYRRRGYTLTLDMRVSESGRAALFVWSVGQRIVQKGPPIVDHGPLSGVLDGYLGADDGGLPGVLAASEKGGLGAVVPRLGGTFAIGVLDKKSDQIEICSSFLAPRPVLYAESADFAVAGSSSLLVHKIAENLGPARYNKEGLADFISAEQYYPFETPFSGVRVLDANCSLTVSSSGCRQVDINDEYRMVGARTGKPTQALFDDMAKALTDNVRSLVAPGFTYDVGLSGGRDSRMVLAALLNIGVDLTAQTTGFDTSADVMLAKRIAGHYDIPIRQNRAKLSQLGSRKMMSHRDLLANVKSCEGIMATRPGDSAEWELIGPKPRDAVLAFYGLAGEMIRGGSFLVPPAYYMQGRTSLTKAEAEEMCANFSKSIYSDWLLPKFKDQHHQRVKHWIDTHQDAGNHCAVIERFAMEHYYVMNHNFLGGIVPMFDNRMLRLAQTVSQSYRILEHVAHGVMKTLKPELTQFPFDGSRWSFEREAPADGDWEAWKKREPVVTTGTYASNYGFYMAGFEMRDEIRSAILESKGTSFLGEIVDLDRVRRLFDSREIYDLKPMWGVWTLYQAALITAGGIEPDDGLVEPPPVEVSIAAPWNSVAWELLETAKALTSYADSVAAAANPIETSTMSKVKHLTSSAVRKSLSAGRQHVIKLPTRAQRWTVGGTFAAAHLARELMTLPGQLNEHRKDPTAAPSREFFGKLLLWLGGTQTNYDIREDVYIEFLSRCALSTPFKLGGQRYSDLGALYRDRAQAEAALNAGEAPPAEAVATIVKDIRHGLHVTVGED